MKKLIKPLLKKIIKKKKLTKTEALVQKHIEKTHDNSYIEIHDDDEHDEHDEHEGYLFTGNTIL